MQEALASALDGRNCSALKQCLDTAIAREELPGWKASNPWANRPVKKIVKERDEHSFDLAIWFLFFFIIRHSLGHTLVTIPYDAPDRSVVYYQPGNVSWQLASMPPTDRTPLARARTAHA